MIAVDASTLRRFLTKDGGPDIDLLRNTIRAREACVPGIVVTELLSDPSLEKPFVLDLRELPLLNLKPSCFERAGLLRAELLRDGAKLSVEKCIIAQSCIDHNVPLITHDRDFRHFVKAGLKLL